MKADADTPQQVSIACQCGCGRSLTLPISRVRPHDFYGCSDSCPGLSPSRFIPLAPGKVRFSTVFKEQGFIRVRDEIPNLAMMRGEWGGPEEWAAIVAARVIDKASKLARGFSICERIEDGLVFYDVLPAWVQKFNEGKKNGTI